MKKILLTTLLTIATSFIFAQSTAQSYKIKAEYIQGNILKFTKRIDSLAKGPVKGVELAIEFQTVGERPWHYYHNFPVYGLAATYLDLGNPKLLGEAIALYPYMNFPLIRGRHASLSIKAGTGISFVTKRYSNTNTDGHQSLTGNAAIGSVMNVYFAGGAALEVPLFRGISLSAAYTWNHISNGSVIAPNEGLNMLNAMAGIKYTPHYNEFSIPHQREMQQLPKVFATELVVAGGIRQLYYKDNKFFAIGSMTLSEYYNFNSWYRMGLGADVFYDGVYGEVNAPKNAAGQETKYQRTYITSDELKNKVRAGVSWQHELMIGRLTAGIHMGLYLYDPIKNLEPYTKLQNGTNIKKGLIYSYDIDNEDGWLYTRAILKYKINNQFFASIGLKTHQQKAEFIEWGIGYRFGNSHVH